MDAANLFSGVQRPFNTITSPDQQDAAATGNDQGPTDQAPGQSPMAKILAAVMRGAARVQGTEQAKSIAKSQMDSNAKMTVTMKPGAPGQPPFVTVKDAPADLLNGTQQSDLVAAHDTPINQVERKLNSQESADNAPSPTPAPTVPPPADHPLEKTFSALDVNQGYREPRPWDPDIREKLKTPDGIRRLNFEMGGTAQDAAVKIRQLKSGEVTLDEAAQRVSNWRLQHGEEKAQKLEAAMAPAEAAKKETLAENKEYALVRNQLLDQKNTMQYDTEDQYLQAVQNGMQVVGGIRPGDEKQFTSAFRSTKIENMNARVKALSGPEGKAAIEAYQPNEGDKFLVEQFPQAKTPFEQNSALRIFNGLQDQKVTRAIEEARKVGAIGAAATPEEAASGMGLDMAMLKPSQQKTVTAAWQTASRDWKSKGLIEKATIQRLDEGNQLERMKIQQNAQQMADNQALIRLQTPEAVAQSVKAVLADGNQLYALPNKTPIERSFRDKVQAQVMAATGGRLPQQIKPGSEDDKRISVVSQGIADTNKIEELYNKWQPVAPLGGPATEMLNRAIIANKPTAYLANLAIQVVPGFSSLSPAKKDEYLSDAATMAHRVNALSIREARSTTGGGRMAVQIVDMFHGITPGFQNPATFKGLVAGARQEFANAENAVRSKQWSGQPPSVQAGSTATPSGQVISDPTTFDKLFPPKKK